MAARYWVLVSDLLMDSGPRWPDGFRPVEEGQKFPGARLWLFEDDSAPASLDGQVVEVIGVLKDGKPAIVRRGPGVQDSWADLTEQQAGAR